MSTNFKINNLQQQATDEQQVDETIEQFEERVLNKRAAQLFVSVRSRLLKTDEMVLSDMTHRNNKKQVRLSFSPERARQDNANIT